MPIGHLSSMEKHLFTCSAFYDWVVCFSHIELHELFIYLEIKSLSVSSFENIFSHYVGCLFALFMVSFAMQKLLSLTRFHHFILFLFSLFQEVNPKKKIAAIYVSVLHMFSSEFIVSDLPFRSLIHF